MYEHLLNLANCISIHISNLIKYNKLKYKVYLFYLLFVTYYWSKIIQLTVYFLNKIFREKHEFYTSKLQNEFRIFWWIKTTR